jgi:short-subunit dehydrogenase
MKTARGIRALPATHTGPANQLLQATSELKDPPLSGKVAVVTGASSGVGRSIAIALAEAGAEVVLLGRRITLLGAVAKQCAKSGSKATCYKVDLLSDQELRGLKKQVMKSSGGVDILVHSAGVIARSNVGNASTKDLDWQYRSNVRAPFALTQLLLPTLIQRKGYIVFINSTAGLVGAAGVSQYAATKHALRGLADSLREEIGAQGVRVLSVFLGRTATAMQAKVHKWEGKGYKPERLIQPEQVARTSPRARSRGHGHKDTSRHKAGILKCGTPNSVSLGIPNSAWSSMFIARRIDAANSVRNSMFIAAKCETARAPLGVPCALFPRADISPEGASAGGWCCNYKHATPTWLFVSA